MRRVEGRRTVSADSAAAGRSKLMAKTRIHALVLIVMLVSAVPARALADSSDDVRTKKAQLAAQIDDLMTD